MREFFLLRTQWGDTGTAGLIYEGNPNSWPNVWHTLELPWKDNKAQESCIPAGIYPVKRHASPRFGNTFEVTGVPGRDEILFHGGNTTADTHGCILLGKIRNDNRLIKSREALQQFFDLIGGEETFQLKVFYTGFPIK